MEDTDALRSQLKAYEAQFKAANGRAPTRADIKLDPARDAQYKRYTMLKSKTNKPNQASTTASSSQLLPSGSEVPASVYKTPTKPIPVRSQRAPTSKPKANVRTTPQSDPFADPAATSIAKPTAYIVANSPKKLRALAAAFATSSPNHPGRSTEKSLEDFVVVGSPKKFNPAAEGLASPHKKKKPGKDRSVESGQGAERAQKARERVFAAAAKLDGDADAAMDVDQDPLMGPSPVKPSANGKKPKLWRPLFDPTPPPPEPLVRPPVPSATIASRRADSAAPAVIKAPTHDHPALQPLRGVKRALAAPLPFESERLVLAKDGEQEIDYASDDSVAAYIDGGKKKGKGKAKPKPKTKPARVPKIKKVKMTGPAEGIIVELNEQGQESTASLRRRNEKEIIILEVGLADGSDEGELEGEPDVGARRARVLIHPRRPYQAHKRRETASDEDRDEERGTVDGTGSLYYRDGADLLASGSAFTMDTSLGAFSEGSNSDEAEDESEQEDDHHSPRRSKISEALDTTAIPASLLSILSIRASPVKKMSRAREQGRDLRVERLLQDPLERNKRERGLSDLIDADRAQQERLDADSDDDWASEVEGWKDLGDGEMDDWDLSS